MRPDITTFATATVPRSGSLRSGSSFYRITAFLTIFAMLFGGILLLSAPTVSARAGEEQGWEEPGPTDDTDAGNGGESTWTDGGVTLYVIGGSLNLREAPAADAAIVSVLADGTAVTTTGEMSGGFYGVTANGASGYAFAEFLAEAPATDAPAEPGPAEPAPTDEVPVDEAPVTDPGPGQDAGLEPVPTGDTATGTITVVDGPLHLRTGPGIEYTYIDVMPTGTPLELLGEIQNGFYPVRFGGYLKGWASAEFLGSDTAPADPGTGETPDPGTGETPDPGTGETPDPGTGETPDSGSVPVPGTEPVGYATTFDGGLNLRSGPGLTYAIVTVMPDGSEVAILGEGQNGFLPISFGGTTGWAFAEYLSTGGTPPPTDDGGTDPVPTTPPTDDGGTDPVPTAPPAEEPDPTEPPSSADGYDSNGDGQWSRDELVAIITDAANAYGQPVEDMVRVAACESVWDPNAVNSSSGASGLFQFMPGTWLTTPYADQDIFDPVANANAAAWMWSVGRRNEWTCQ